MQSSFDSVKSCLDYWEFCPVCSARLNVDIGLHNSGDVLITKLDNNKLTACQIFDEINQRQILELELATNTVNCSQAISLMPYIRLNCKHFHFSISYNITTDQNPQPIINKLGFWVCDTKYSLNYNVISDYITNTTIISLSGTNISQELKQPLISFRNFSKNKLIKNIRAICLLG